MSAPVRDLDAEPRRSLADLAPGDEAVIDAVAMGERETERLVGRRLEDLGFVPGTRVKVVRRAILGDPTVYALRGSLLALRRSEAARIRVRASEAP